MRFPGLVAVIAMMALNASAVEGAHWTAHEGRELIGRPAPEWDGLHWLNSPALTLSQLRGKVVLIRFWFTDCSLCAATAPALNYLHERYHDRGLVVVGIHHPKSARGADPDYVRQGAAQLGFKFPIAQDQKWATVKRYWLDTGARSFTSASFLIDREGRIRWIHDGGEFHAGGGPGHGNCEAAFQSLEQEIQALLAKQ